MAATLRLAHEAGGVLVFGSVGGQVSPLREVFDDVFSCEASARRHVGAREGRDADTPGNGRLPAWARTRNDPRRDLGGAMGICQAAQRMFYCNVWREWMECLANPHRRPHGNV